MNENESSGNQEPSLEDRIADHLFKGDSDYTPTQTTQNTQAEVTQPEEIEQTNEQPENTDSVGLDAVEYEGKTYQVPTEIKEALLRQSDYTKKSQEVADIRRSAELKAKAMADAEAFGNSVRKEVSEVQAISSQLEQYKTLDWSQMTAEQMYLAKHNMDLLKEKRNEIQESLKGKQNEFMRNREQKRQELIGETVKYLGTQVRGWSDKHGEELTSYVKGLGYQQDSMLNMFTDPVLTSALWKAKQWDNLQAQKGDLTKKVNGVPPVVKPGSSNPEMQAKMKDLNLSKQIKNAKTPSEKNKLIQQRLESRFFKDM